MSGWQLFLFWSAYEVELVSSTGSEVTEVLLAIERGDYTWVFHFWIEITARPMAYASGLH
jgi:hypothetical protein